MNRRSTAIVTAFVLLMACGAAAAFMTVPFVRYQPGPTVDVLGEQTNGKPIVAVRGHKTYPTAGQLRMTTVRTSSRDANPNLMEALWAWVDPDQSLIPYDSLYGDEGTTEEDRTESQLQMVSSQDDAIAAALRELGFELTSTVQVRGTIPGGAADGKLKTHDIIESVDGIEVTSVEQVGEIITAKSPGDEVTIDIRRSRKPMTFQLTTKAAEDDPDRAVIGIYPGLGYDFPFDVSVKIPEAIGGPSAGLIFSLAVYDTLTPGALTDGVSIAGTGSIDEKGRVGPIGGIQQKIAGAEADGARLFLVPPDNCDAAALAHTDLTLVRAETMHSAVKAIQAYVDDPAAELPACDGVDR